MTAVSSNIATANPTELELTLRKCRSAFGYAAFFSLCINLLTVLTAIYSMQVLDRVFSSRSYETLGMLSLMMGVAILFLGLFSWVRMIVLESTGAWLDQRLSPLLFARAIRQNASGQAAAASQQQRDLASLRQFVTGLGIVTLFDAPWSIVYLAMTVAISAALGWVALLGCLLLLLLGVLTELATRRPLEQSQKVNLRALAFTETANRHAETIEAMGMLPAIQGQWRRISGETQVLQRRAGHRSALLQSLSRAVRMSLQVAITGLGAYLALERELTAGGLIAASILAARAFAPFEGAIAFWKQVITARDAYQRLNQAVAGPLRERGDIELPTPRGLLAAEQLAWQPAPGTRPILRNVSFLLQPGESLGIVGPSGAGKTTLTRLLTGVMAPSIGHVRLDGNDVAIWGRGSLGPHLGYVPQQVDLFPGTIRQNIARMEENAPPAAVIEAAELAGVHALIQRLPLGYDTPWSASQPTLSPGQKQRIALARAVYGSPKLIVLDEPNLNLDGEGEAALITMLQLLKLRRSTVIVVAHKPSIIACLDKMLVLKDGVVEQFGPREQIMLAFTRPAGVKA